MKNKTIIFNLLKIKNLINKASKKKIFLNNKITIANYEILKTIQEEKVKTISEIQSFIPDSLSSLTQKTQKLIQLNFLKKEKDKIDPRKNILTITNEGLKLIKKTEEKIELVSSFVFKKYSREEKEIFVKMLNDLIKKIEKKTK